jgi:hypothetical protein
MKNILSTLIILFAIQAQSQEFMSDFFAPPGQKKITLFGKYGSSIKEPDIDDHYEENDFKALVPVYQNETSAYMVTGSYTELRLSKNNQNSNTRVPEKLSDQKYGIGWSSQDEERNSWSANVTYGSASDDPFAGSDVSTFSGTLTRKVNKTKTSSYIYFLNFSNNRGFLDNIPIPGFAYLFFEPDFKSGGAIGLPFFFYFWKPTPKISTNVFMLVPSMFKGTVGYALNETNEAQLKLEFAQQVFQQHNRKENRERMIYDTLKVVGGLKHSFEKTSYIEASLARVINRRFFYGRSVFDVSGEAVQLPEEWQLTLAAQYAF